MTHRPLLATGVIALVLACTPKPASLQTPEVPPAEASDPCSPEGFSILANQVIDDGQGGLEPLVNDGCEAHARSYYEKVSKVLGFPVLESDLQGMLDFMGYKGALTPSELEMLPSSEIMATTEDALSAIHFAPKIVNVKDEGEGGYGWRKILRLPATDVSPAKEKGILSLWLLFNFDNTDPEFPTGKRAGQIQAMLERVKDARDPVYFFVYEPNSEGYTIRLFLNASFDASHLKPDHKYYVPTACAQCHGVTEDAMAKVKINYLDTDHWYDRRGDADFPKLPIDQVLPEGGAPGTESYSAVFEVFRKMNTEILAQNERVDPEGFQREATDTWLKIHKGQDEPVRDLYKRSLWSQDNTKEKWTETDEALLKELNRFCFRCHSSLAFSVFDKDAVIFDKGGVNSRVNAMIGRIDSRRDAVRMPQDRILTDDEKAALKTELCKLDPNVPRCK